jgi:hypothetical protein
VGDTVSYDGSCCCKNDCGACLGNVPDSLTLTLHHPDPALDGMSVTITHVAFSQTWFGALTTASNPCGVTGGVTTVIQGRMDCVPGTVGVSFQFTITFKDAGGGLICDMNFPSPPGLTPICSPFGGMSNTTLFAGCAPSTGTTCTDPTLGVSVSVAP